ncbi:MAG TPA: hypothetical protein VIJ94_19880 [Caulobacteraceae bacterium]
MTPASVSPFDPQATWHETAVRQGILCLVCSDAPRLEHRAAFYDTGLCESCSRELLSKESAPPSP